MRLLVLSGVLVTAASAVAGAGPDRTCAIAGDPAPAAHIAGDCDPCADPSHPALAVPTETPPPAAAPIAAPLAAPAARAATAAAVLAFAPKTSPPLARWS